MVVRIWTWTLAPALDIKGLRCGRRRGENGLAKYAELEQFDWH
jgi:hypothetical protein